MKNPIASRRTSITREGWCYAIVMTLVFAAALVQEVNLLVALAAMLAGPLLLGRFMAVFSLRGLQVRRKAPHGVCAGDLLVSRVALSNSRRSVGSWAVLVEEEIHRDALGDAGRRRKEKSLHTSVFFPYLPAGRMRQAAYRGRLARRGRYRLGPLRVSTRFPFGLFCHTLTVAESESLLVFPRLGRLTRGWAQRRREAFAGSNRREQRPGADGDFYGVRPWRSGDSRRWIHWRTSARAGKLVVRQFEQPRNRDVVLLLDLWQPDRPEAADRANVELAVSFAATIIADLCRKGDSNVYLSVGDHRAECAGGPASPALLQEMMEQLATIEGHSRDDLADVLAQAERRAGSAAELVLIATRRVDLDDPARWGRLAGDAALRAMLRRVRAIDVSSPELGRFFRME